MLQFLKLKIRGIYRALLDILFSVQDHNLFTHAAACAFFLFLSLPPALLALVTLVGMIPIEAWTESTTIEVIEWITWAAGFLLPQEIVSCLGLGFEIRFYPDLLQLQDMSAVRVQSQVSEFLGGRVPQDLADSLEAIAKNILDNPRRGLLTVSFLVIVWSASGVTRAAMRAMSAIYEVRYRSMVGRNALSLALTIGFLISWTVIFALLPVSRTLSHLVVDYFGLDQGVGIVWSGINWGIGALMLLLSVLGLNRLGPDVQLRVWALLPGSIFTVLSWVLMTGAMGTWMTESWEHYDATYGVLAVIIVLLLWCYLMALGLLLGAELNTTILRLRARGLEAAGKDHRQATRAAVETEIVANPLSLGGLTESHPKKE